MSFDGQTDGKKFRREDGKVFTRVILSHWSIVKADDGETDTIKWYGGENYVSGEKGLTYKELA